MGRDTKPMTLQPMSTAPRDGRAVVLVRDDYSGVEVGRYGEHVSEHFKGVDSWFELDFSDELGPEEWWAGWLCAPDLPGWGPGGT